MGHVRPLVGLPDEKAKQVAKRAIDEKFSVRRVEDIVKGMKLSEKKAEKKDTKSGSKTDKKYDYAEGLLRKKYHTNIKIDDKTITIKYKGNEDLNRLLELMGVIEDI